MGSLVSRATRSIRRRLSHARSDAYIRRINQDIAAHAPAPAPGTAPVIFFNASTRLTGVSLNAAYGLIASWAVRLAGVPVIHFVSKNGMTHCVLGTQRTEVKTPPPCDDCIRQSQVLYDQSNVCWFAFEDDSALQLELRGLSSAEMMAFVYQDVPLGQLVLPSMRWILRLHHLVDDENTRYLYREYIRSAWSVYRSFSRLLDEAQPQAVVVFNGMFYPEATARWAALRRGIRVITHEVGLRPLTAFFTPGEATAYPIDIRDDFQLTEEQEHRLDSYLDKRMQGNFSMAGVRFWPEMRRLDDAFLARLAPFRQVVPVFTNVIFDTSQPHSNVVFPHMFAWLDLVAEIARDHPETLFVIRAHPDEARPGKESRESVSAWVKKNYVSAMHNVLFIEPQEYLSSYELIERSKFVMVYNSTIGLEASLMGSAVLCGGRARFTQLPTVIFPDSPDAYRQKAEELLNISSVQVPPEYRRNARRFLYYQLFRTSLPFDSFIEEDGVWPGYVRLKDQDYTAFDPQNAPVLRTIVNGILREHEFLI